MNHPALNKFLFIQFISFTCLAMKVLAAPADSSVKEVQIPTVLKYIHEHDFTAQDVRFHLLDTTLNDLEVINPAYREHFNFLANTGSAAQPQVYNLKPVTFTDGGMHLYDLYLFSSKKIRYYKTNKAFTELNYHLAGGKEQQLDVSLTENILKNWNVGFNFNRFGSTGFLRNGTTYHSDFDLYTWIHSANERYNLFASAIWNTIENKMNGGLNSDSIYDGSSISNLALQGLLINLADAEHHFRNHEFSLRQFYDLGSSTEEKISDSLSRFHFKPTFRIEHSISLETRSLTYLDGNPGTFYRNSFFSSSSLDSLHYDDLRNRLTLLTLGNKKDSGDSLRSMYYSFGVEHQWLRYYQSAETAGQLQDTIVTNTRFFAGAENRQDENHLHVAANGDYVFAGANKGDYSGTLSAETPVHHSGKIELSGKIALLSPDYAYQRYYSNHFVWENNFEKSLLKNVSLCYSFSKIHLSAGAEMFLISNFIYLDSTAVPVQNQSETKIIRAFLNKNFTVGKFHLNNSFILQKTHNEEALHLPLLVSTQSLFFESFLYKKALLLRTGFDLRFNSAYYADAFMPSTGFFYWQNVKKTGGYALVDFFVDFRIKTAKIFIKFENTGDNLFNKGYYLTPHYAMQGMTLQFGLSWRFFDQ
ncbi:MAG: hypothetical protein NT126_08770 [Bacteroidetes bacterium]|nr:hypothetical protein [Bacteroidota bacterium]